MLDNLRSADFIGRLHEVFHVHLEGSDPIDLELVSVAEAEDSVGAPTAGRRRPFSLVFLGPESSLYLQQHIYHLQHDQLGTLDLFIVPIGPAGKRMRYEAVFA